MSMLRAILAFLWKRDSESAACLCICLARHLSPRDQDDLREYLTAKSKFIDFKTVVLDGQYWVDEKTFEKLGPDGFKFLQHLNKTSRESR